ncbi:MAG: BolA/IbaG family iron-sulfur metabolism protein [Candidatus Eremiobacteraeota bacterium]|nr:BolA/IbaG family iron-sulfur metabolism protein [Candidatus Eremiobacteraeota bacterium]
MIENDALEALIRNKLPDADVRIVDRTGTMDHFNLTIRSSAFSGKTLLEQHRAVYDALGNALRDGRVHAVELKTITTENEQCPTV